MSSLAVRLSKLLRVSSPFSSLVGGVQRNSKMLYSSEPLDNDDDINDQKVDEQEEEFGNYLGGKRESIAQGVNPGKGWNFRGVHKAIICGKVKDAPVQKILRNGRTLTIFSVGTGGLFDQRIIGTNDLPKPIQWHRIAVHSDPLGAFAVQNLVKNSSVYVEGDIETRVYNDGINGEIKNVPEICVRRDGTLRLIKTGESISNAAIEDLKEGLD